MGDRKQRRRGLTLLELMLAIALSGLVLYTIGMAVDLNLRTLQQRRNVIEQSRVARALVRLIAADLKRTVTPYEQDLSALEAMGEGAAAEALAALASVGEGDLDAAADALGDAASGGASGGGGASTGSGGAGESSEDASAGDASTDDAMETAEESAYTQDLAGATTLPPKPGLYGNQYQLQLDISRLPRFDEFFQSAPTTAGELVDVVSNVKTVAYYVQTEQDAGVYGAQDVFGDTSVVAGLVRRELDRTVTQYALNNGNSSGLQQRAEIIAPEVVGLEFRYFDGLEWLMEWDSDLKGGLPLAIEILMLVRPVDELQRGATFDPSSMEIEPIDIMTYRTIVRLPTAKATFGNEQEALDLEAVGL